VARMSLHFNNNTMTWSSAVPDAWLLIRIPFRNRRMMTRSLIRFLKQRPLHHQAKSVKLLQDSRTLQRTLVKQDLSTKTWTLLRTAMNLPALLFPPCLLTVKKMRMNIFPPRKVKITKKRLPRRSHPQHRVVHRSRGGRATY